MGTYVDANLYHDMLTGKAVTGILHFLNQTPFDWFTKKQATVETATFGSENSAARTAIAADTKNIYVNFDYSASYATSITSWMNGNARGRNIRIIWGAINDSFDFSP
jgi:hypothetical protein